jgi:hypothetical protein
VGFVVDKVTLGQVFSKYFGFRCQLSLHQILQLSIIWGWYEEDTNGSKIAVMYIIVSLCVSLGSSTVQFHDSLGSGHAVACSEACFSCQNGDRA